MRDLSFRQGIIAAIKADTLSLTAWQVGMYGFMAFAYFLVFRTLLGIDLKTNMVEFWFMMQIAMFCGFLTSYPVNWWLIRSGLKEEMSGPRLLRGTGRRNSLVLALSLRGCLTEMTRFLLLRYLIVLLSLALASGNAHAALHLGHVHSEPCPQEHAQHSGKTSHQHQPDKGLACCCDCLGCSSVVYLPRELSITPAGLAAKIGSPDKLRLPLGPDASARSRSPRLSALS